MMMSVVGVRVALIGRLIGVEAVRVAVDVDVFGEVVFEAVPAAFKDGNF